MKKFLTLIALVSAGFLNAAQAADLPPEATAADITAFTQYTQSIALIKSPGGHANGFFTDATHVVSARHILEDISGDGVYVYDSEGKRHRVVKIDKSYDADAIMIEVDSPNPNIVPAKIACVMPAAFETLLAAGNPLDMRNVVSPVMVVGFSDERDLDDVISVVVAGTLAPGMSGGPLYNRNGEVVALVSNSSMFSVDGKTVIPSGFHEVVPLIAIPELCQPVDNADGTPEVAPEAPEVPGEE